MSLRFLTTPARAGEPAKLHVQRMCVNVSVNRVTSLCDACARTDLALE
jgi:hypothetical protein